MEIIKGHGLKLSEKVPNNKVKMFGEHLVEITAKHFERAGSNQDVGESDKVT